MKTLVIVVHPELDASRINRAWMKRLTDLRSPDVTVHDLYARYRDRPIDVAHEQALLEAHDRVIFQFPFYWYSSPPLLKAWIDAVFEYGWAYGHGGHALEGKEMGIALSTWTGESSYQHSGSVMHTIEELTWPFEATVRRVGATWLPPFVLNGVGDVDAKRLDASANAYLAHVTGTSIDDRLVA
jgi:putative NADPH-quinone reductase